MSSDMRIVKFKMLVRDIWEDLGKICLCLSYGYDASLLSLIYDYDKLNDYGKAIMEQVCELEEGVYGDLIQHSEELCKNMEYRMKAAKEFVTDPINIYSYEEKISFLFWSLMILVVDDTDKEEHLSLICDFAKMLKISDEEMLDIVQIILAIYHMERNFTIKTRNVKSYFEKVIKRYEIKVNTGALNEVTQSMLGIFLQ